MPKMDEAAKAAKIEGLQEKLTGLIAEVRTEADIKKKRRMIGEIGNLNRQIDKIKSGRILSREAKRDLVAYSFIAPNFIGFCVFTLIPIIFAFALAFLKWDGSNPIEWAGIGNFLKLTDDTFFRAALINTIIYCVGTVPLTMIASLALAIVLNQKVVGRGIFRTLSFFPYVASLVAITAVWKMLFHPSKGPINSILYNVFHVAQEDLPQWFTGGLVLFSMILFSMWKYMGYYMVIYLAGLQGISAELYEAASLDGANTWNKFRYVTWPQLSSTTFFVVVMLTINCFKVYDVAIMLAGGGSGELTTSSTVLVYYIYQKAFIDWDLGYSSAVAMVLFLMVLLVTIIQFRGQAKRERA
ncbi:MAG: sugar ABC transporter permease [Lachnospiraceae bacterium]|nr:sugar ABC transporter permease [Lachnospiraceae bacterium]